MSGVMGLKVFFDSRVVSVVVLVIMVGVKKWLCFWSVLLLFMISFVSVVIVVLIWLVIFVCWVVDIIGLMLVVGLSGLLSCSVWVWLMNDCR